MLHLRQIKRAIYVRHCIEYISVFTIMALIHLRGTTTTTTTILYYYYYYYYSVMGIFIGWF